MNNAQRNAWDAEFGEPKFPYLGYSCERELSEADYENMRQHQLSKLAGCQRVHDEIEKKFVEYFLKKP